MPLDIKSGMSLETEWSLSSIFLVDFSLLESIAWVRSPSSHILCKGFSLHSWNCFCLLFKTQLHMKVDMLGAYAPREIWVCETRPTASDERTYPLRNIPPFSSDNLNKSPDTFLFTHIISLWFIFISYVIWKIRVCECFTFWFTIEQENNFTWLCLRWNIVS